MEEKTNGQINSQNGCGGAQAQRQVDPGPRLIEEIDNKIEHHGREIARLSRLKETAPDGLLRMRMYELRELAYLVADL
jgi:hypothetical protein